jgi:SulP family sulfate permease
LTIVTLLILTGLFEQLPEATLAAVVIAAVIELVDVQALIKLYRDTTRGLNRVAARPDFIAAVAAMLGVLVFDTLPGLFIGISMSLLLLLYRASRPYVATLGRVPGSEQYGDVRRHPENRPPDGVPVLRVEGGVYFANADAIRGHIMRAASADGVRAVVLDAGTIPFVDVTAARMLGELAGDLRRRGIEVLIVRDVGQVRDLLGREAPDPALQHVYPSVQAAVDAAASQPPVPA